MTKNYYRSEYSDKQWKALIDKAAELGCQITYSKYGNIVTIDSTDRESSIIAQTGRGGQDRVVWAERIHGMIQESTDFRTCSPRDTAKAIVRLFASYTEANDYRQKCQRSWIGHCDYVYLWTGSERINLTRMPKDERNKLLKQFNIPE